MEAAVKRGVAVRALIAHTNSGGEKRLRQLELRMLDKGVMVSRTADELVRYHGKMMIVDREELHVYGFNYTALDVEEPQLRHRHRRTARSCRRRCACSKPTSAARSSSPSLEEGFVVSPENAREQLATFIKRAKQAAVDLRSQAHRPADDSPDSPARARPASTSACSARSASAAATCACRRCPATPARARDDPRRGHGLRRQPEPARARARPAARGRPDRPATPRS